MKRIVITVGQFIHRKGFDILLKAWAHCSEEYELYIIGGKPTPEYIELVRKLNLKNVFFEDFKTKEELKQYYQAADLFVLPTREDIWGLVVNEAMANGLPVITTDRCGAGLELIKDGENGYIVPVEDEKALAEKISCILNDNIRCSIMAMNSIKNIKNYVIKNMVMKHNETFQIFK